MNIRQTLVTFAVALTGFAFVACTTQVPADGSSDQAAKAKKKKSADDDDETEGGEDTDDTGGSTPKKSSSKEDDSGDPAPEDKGGDPTPDPGEEQPPPGEMKVCTAETTRDACEKCCADNLPEAPKVDPGGQAFADCACKAPGSCKTACATSLCTGAKPNAACGACLDNKVGAACDKQVASQCSADPLCTQLTKCWDTCATKK